MRSRLLLTALALLTVVLLASFAPLSAPSADTTPAPLIQAPSTDSLFSDIDLDAIPDRPFARFTLNSPRRPDGTRCGVMRDCVPFLSADFRHLTAAVPGGREWTWDVPDGRTVGDRPASARRPYTENCHTSADGRVYTSSTLSWSEPSKSTLFAPHLPAEGVALLPEAKDRSVWPLAVSPDGRWLYLAEGREVQVWSTEAVQPVRTLFRIATLEGHDPQGFDVMPSPDGRRVAVFVDEEFRVTYRGGRMCGLDLPPFPCQPSGGPRRVFILDTATWMTTHEYRAEGRADRWWVGGDCLATQRCDSDKDVGQLIYRTELRRLDGGRVESFSASIPASHGMWNNCLNAERRWKAAWGEKGYAPTDRVRLSDLFDERRTREFQVPGPISRVAFTPDTRVLIVFHTDDTVSLFDLCGFTKPPDDYAVGRLWDDLISDNATAVYRAVRWAIEHPADAMPVLAREAEGRERVGAERVKGWVDDLSSRDFHTRETATRKLAEHLADVRPALEKAAETAATPEAEVRLTTLLAKPDPPTPEARRSRWAVFVLEQIGTPEGKAILRDWALHLRPHGLTPEAYRAVQRLDAW